MHGRCSGGAHSFPGDGRVEQLFPREGDLTSRVHEHAERRHREQQAVEDHNLRRLAEASERPRFERWRVRRRWRVAGRVQRACELYTTPRTLLGFGPNGSNR